MTLVCLFWVMGPFNGISQATQTADILKNKMFSSIRPIVYRLNHKSMFFISEHMTYLRVARSTMRILYINKSDIS